MVFPKRCSPNLSHILCSVSSIFGRKPYGHKRSQSEREKQRAFPDIIKNVDFSEFEESVADDKVMPYSESMT